MWAASTAVIASPSELTEVDWHVVGNPLIDLGVSTWRILDLRLAVEDSHDLIGRGRWTLVGQSGRFYARA